MMNVKNTHRTQISNFWNNHQQARSQSKDWKTKIILKSLAINEVSQIWNDESENCRFFFYINPQITIPIVISSRVGVRPFMTDGRTDSGMP